MQATTAGVRLDVGKAARFSALCSQLSFRPPAAHPVEPFILPKTREGAILAPQPCRIWGMSGHTSRSTDFSSIVYDSRTAGHDDPGPLTGNQLAGNQLDRRRRR